MSIASLCLCILILLFLVIFIWIYFTPRRIKELDQDLLNDLGYIEGCPEGSNLRITQVPTDTPGCYCSNEYFWDGRRCVPCPNGSGAEYTSEVTNVPGCYCYYGSVWDGQECIANTCSYDKLPYDTGSISLGGCFCPPNQGLLNGICAECPSYSSPWENGNPTEVVGCNCHGTDQYSSELYKCVKCPPSTSTTYTGGPAGNDGCYCQGGQGWNGNYCVTCPNGSSNSNYNQPNTAVSGAIGCYCGLNTTWQGTACVSNTSGGTTSGGTPSGSTTSGGTTSGGTTSGGTTSGGTTSGGTPSGSTIVCPTNSSTTQTASANPNVSGCYCNLGYTYSPSNGQCNYECPPDSDPSYTGATIPGTNGCNCLNGYSVNGNSCIPSASIASSVCPGNSILKTAQNAAQLSTTSVPGNSNCYCALNTNWSSVVNKCLNCSIFNSSEVPAGGGTAVTSTATTTSGGISTTLNGCYCPASAGFDSVNNVCVACSTLDSNTTASTVNMPGLNQFGNVLGCYCSTDYYYDTTSSACAACPAGSVTLNDTSAPPVSTAVSAGTSAPGCYCKVGYAPNASSAGCTACPAGSTTTNDTTQTTNSIEVPNTQGCYCTGTNALSSTTSGGVTTYTCTACPSTTTLSAGNPQGLPAVPNMSSCVCTGNQGVVKNVTGSGSSSVTTYSCGNCPTNTATVAYATVNNLPGAQYIGNNYADPTYGGCYALNDYGYNTTTLSYNTCPSNSGSCANQDPTNLNGTTNTVTNYLGCCCPVNLTWSTTNNKCQ